MKTSPGLHLALVAAGISGLSIYLNKFAVSVIPDPLLLTMLKNSLVGVALIVYLLLRPPSAPPSRRADGLGLSALALLGGSVPFALFFTGLATAAAPSAALIHKTLVLWVALGAGLLLKEPLTRWTVLGVGTLLLGQCLAGWPSAWGWGNGETLILFATWLWAAETLWLKRLLPHVPVTLAATARMAGGGILLWLYWFSVTPNPAHALALSPMQWGWVALTSALLLGYVITWYTALAHAPATAVTGLLTLGALITVGLTVGLDGISMRLALGITALVLGSVLLAHSSSPRKVHAHLAST
jgi:drug/metabolite transporter (DMT)-like permease